MRSMQEPYSLMTIACGASVALAKPWEAWCGMCVDREYSRGRDQRNHVARRAAVTERREP